MGEMELQTSGVWRSDSNAEAAGPAHKRRPSAGTSVEWREEVGRVCGWEQEPGKWQTEALFLAPPDIPRYTKQVASLLGPASQSCPPAAALGTDTECRWAQVQTTQPWVSALSMVNRSNKHTQGISVKQLPPVLLIASENTEVSYGSYILYFGKPYCWF